MTDFAICFEIGTVEFKCSRCTDGTVGDEYCSHCDGAGVLIEYVKTWFDNLANAAALCAAFRAGFDDGWGCTGEGFNAEYARFKRTTYEQLATVGGTQADEWRPGCGRAAPGWSER